MLTSFLFLFLDILYCWLLNIELIALSLMPKYSLSNRCYFLCKAHHSFLGLRNIRKHFNTMLGVILKNKITNKTKKCKNSVTKAGHKKPLLIIWKLKQEGRALPCLNSPAGNVHVGQLQFLTILCISVNDHNSSVSVGWGITIKF